MSESTPQAAQSPEVDKAIREYDTASDWRKFTGVVAAVAVGAAVLATAPVTAPVAGVALLAGGASFVAGMVTWGVQEEGIVGPGAQKYRERIEKAQARSGLDSMAAARQARSAAVASIETSPEYKSRASSGPGMS